MGNYTRTRNIRERLNNDIVMDSPRKWGVRSIGILILRPFFVKKNRGKFGLRGIYREGLFAEVFYESSRTRVHAYVRAYTRTRIHARGIETRLRTRTYMHTRTCARGIGTRPRARARASDCLLLILHIRNSLFTRLISAEVTFGSPTGAGRYFKQQTKVPPCGVRAGLPTPARFVLGGPSGTECRVTWNGVNE